MVKFLVRTLLLLLISPSVFAAGRSASAIIQATFVVREACTILVQPGRAPSPNVICKYNTPYELKDSAPQGKVEELTIYF